MPQTYAAVLRDGQIEWTSPPPVLPPDLAIPVQITLLQPTPQKPDPAAAIAALRAIAEQGGPKNFGDPVEWQRETRKSRPLPGREE